MANGNIQTTLKDKMGHPFLPIICTCVNSNNSSPFRVRFSPTRAFLDQRNITTELFGLYMCRIDNILLQLGHWSRASLEADDDLYRKYIHTDI